MSAASEAQGRPAAGLMKCLRLLLRVQDHLLLSETGNEYCNDSGI